MKQHCLTFIYQMEKIVNDKIVSYIGGMKQDMINIVKNGKINEMDSDSVVYQIMNYIYEKPILKLEKSDFVKRKRMKTLVPQYDRCLARRANNEQCTRRKKNGDCYCGTHIKGRPHGEMTQEVVNNGKKKEVMTQDIKGIIYFLDMDGNVYHIDDIKNSVHNPRIIAKYTKEGDEYHIPSFNI